jgi:hypothetical protein
MSFPHDVIYFVFVGIARKIPFAFGVIHLFGTGREGRMALYDCEMSKCIEAEAGKDDETRLVLFCYSCICGMQSV